MSASAGRIRGFLLQNPKASLIRVTTADGDIQEMQPGRSYTKQADTIAAIGGQLLECIDAGGKLLRAMRLDDDESTRPASPTLPAPLVQDPHAAMLMHFANLLANAYQHSTEIAFTKLVELTDKMNDRSDAIEQRLERAEATARRAREELHEQALDMAQDAIENAKQQAAESNLGEQLLGSFMGGQRSAPASNGKHTASNGKAG